MISCTLREFPDDSCQLLTIVHLPASPCGIITPKAALTPGLPKRKTLLPEGFIAEYCLGSLRIGDRILHRAKDPVQMGLGELGRQPTHHGNHHQRN